MIEVTTTSAAATRRLAARLASLLTPPAVLALEGNLGSGKTTFVQGLVYSLPGGAGLRVQSPTFALARTYPTTPSVHHLDLYRLDDEESARDLGLLDMAADEGALTCIEWPERAPSLYESDRVLIVRFPPNASRRRKIVIDGPLSVSLGASVDDLRAAVVAPSR